MNNLKLFGKRIKELRKKKKITQEQLGEIVGVDNKQIGNIETGTYFTTMPTLEKIAFALDCELKELFDFGHIKSKEDMLSEINNLLISADEEKIKIAYRLMKDILK